MPSASTITGAREIIGKDSETGFSLASLLHIFFNKSDTARRNYSKNIKNSIGHKVLKRHPWNCCTSQNNFLS